MKACASAAILLFLLLAGCAGVSTEHQQCLANAMCAARLAEPGILSKATSVAHRDGDTLILTPSSGTRVLLTDHRDTCTLGDVAQCQSFALMDYVPAAHALVVQEFFYEGGDYFLIDDRSGRQTHLNGMPIFSPKGDEFLVAPRDDENDVGPNDLEIWRRVDDGAVLEWAHTFRQTQADEPALQSPLVFHIQRWDTGHILLTLSPEGEPDKSWAGSLTRESAGWHLSAKSPPGLLHPYGDAAP